MTITVSTDGSALGNPNGPMGWAWADHEQNAGGKEVRTDENNFVVDLHLERIDHPQELAEDLINTVGVVEHGLFLNMVDKVIVGDPNGPRVMTNANK